MRGILIIFLSLLPTVLLAQLDIDGKTDVGPSKNPTGKDSHPFTILYSGSLIEIPFGLKFQYCKSFGAYASFKSDFDLTMNHYHVTAGPVKSLGKAVDLYLGGGLDFGTWDDSNGYGDGYYRNAPCLLIETGIILKIRRFALDLGVGVAPEEYTEYFNGNEEPSSSLFGNFGLGFNF